MFKKGHEEREIETAKNFAACKLNTANLLGIGDKL